MLKTLNLNVFVKLTAKFINKAIQEIDEEILQQLQKTYGNKCYLNYGYVYGSSITLIKRSTGQLDNLIVDGGLVYSVNFAANVCKPEEDDIITCVILQKNKECIGCETINDLKNILEIIVPVSWHEEPLLTKIKAIELDSIIEVKVIGTRFEPQSNNIRTICSFVRKL